MKLQSSFGCRELAFIGSGSFKIFRLRANDLLFNWRLKKFSDNIFAWRICIFHIIFALQFLFF